MIGMNESPAATIWTVAPTPYSPFCLLMGSAIPIENIAMTMMNLTTNQAIS
jgi:hypothetical protein